MKRPVRTGVPERVTSLTSTTPRAVVTSIRRPALVAVISKVWVPPCPVSTTASTRSPFIGLLRLARDGRDVAKTLDLREHLGQLLERGDLERGGDRRRAVGVRRDRGGDDVHLVLGDDVRDLVQQARTVERGDAHGDRVGLLPDELPLDVDQ